MAKEKSKAYREVYQFEVEIKQHKGGSSNIVHVHACYAHINPRGDLYFTNSGGYETPVVAAFHAGSWVRLSRVAAKHGGIITEEQVSVV